jgi:hypothetical protein
VCQASRHSPEGSSTLRRTCLGLHTAAGFLSLLLADLLLGSMSESCGARARSLGNFIQESRHGVDGDGCERSHGKGDASPVSGDSELEQRLVRGVNADPMQPAGSQERPHHYDGGSQPDTPPK